MSEICSSCRLEVTGGFEVYERVAKDGTPMVIVDSTPDRNYNVCDACNITICFNCSEDANSGLCNGCLHRYR